MAKMDRKPSDESLLNRVEKGVPGTRDITDSYAELDPNELPEHIPLEEIEGGATGGQDQQDDTQDAISLIDLNAMGAQEEQERTQNQPPMVESLDSAVGSMDRDERLDLIITMLNGLPDEIADMMRLG